MDFRIWVGWLPLWVVVWLTRKRCVSYHIGELDERYHQPFLGVLVMNKDDLQEIINRRRIRDYEDKIRMLQRKEPDHD